MPGSIWSPPFQSWSYVCSNASSWSDESTGGTAHGGAWRGATSTSLRTAGSGWSKDAMGAPRAAASGMTSKTRTPRWSASEGCWSGPASGESCADSRTQRIAGVRRYHAKKRRQEAVNHNGSLVRPALRFRDASSIPDVPPDVLRRGLRDQPVDGPDEAGRRRPGGGAMDLAVRHLP